MEDLRGRPSVSLHDCCYLHVFRILELTPLSRVEEAVEEDQEEEGAVDDQEETVPNADEYRKAPLTFQERSLRQYFKAINVQDENEELRTPALDAHTTILTMCVEVLKRSTARTKDGKAPELRRYAVKYWYDHFNELDPDKATETQVGQVLQCLHSVLTDEKRVSRVFDHCADSTEIYPIVKQGDPDPWYNRINAWIGRASDLPADVISPDIRAWANRLVASDEHVLYALSLAHGRNWLSLRSQLSITQAWWTTKALAIIVSSVLTVRDRLTLLVRSA